MKQEIIADLSRITEEEQAILDGKTEVEKERYSSGQKFVMDAGKLLKRGKLIDIRPHTRFIRFPAHSHNYVEMIYMCQGSTVHTINGDRIELKAGELLILNQNAVQEIEPAGRDDIAVNFLILPEFFDQTLRMIGAEENQLKDFIVGCLKSGEVPLCYLHYRIADVLPVQNLIENLVLSSDSRSVFLVLLYFLLHPVLLRRYSIALFENPMEITHVLIPDPLADVCHGKSRRFQQIRGLGQAFVLNEFSVVFPSQAADHAA